jgi:hypothetical protein
MVINSHHHICMLLSWHKDRTLHHMSGNTTTLCKVWSSKPDWLYAGQAEQQSMTQRQ